MLKQSRGGALYPLPLALYPEKYEGQVSRHIFQLDSLWLGGWTEWGQQSSGGPSSDLDEVCGNSEVNLGIA